MAATCPVSSGASNAAPKCPVGFSKSNFNNQSAFPANNFFGSGYPSAGLPAYNGPATFGPAGSCPWKTSYADADFFPGSAFGCPALFSSNGGCPLGYGNQTNNWTYCNVAFRPTHSIEFFTLTNPIRMDRDGNRKLWLCYELKGFLPEEITVTLNKTEKLVVVEAKQEVKDGKTHYVSRTFCRKFALPDSAAKVDLAKLELKSYLNHYDGILTIECDLPKLSAEDIAKCPMLSKQAAETNAHSAMFAGLPGFGAGYNACPVSSVCTKSN